MIALNVRGWLEDEVGKKRVVMNASSIYDAVDILSISVKNLKNKLAEGLFQVCIGPKPIDKEEDLMGPSLQVDETALHAQFTNDLLEVWITPVLAGEDSKGWLTAIVGVAFIVIGSYVPVVGTYMQTFGFGLVLMGIGQIISPGIQNPEPGDFGEETNKSFLYSGQGKNRLDQGAYVPLHYGKFHAVPQTVSLSLTAEDIDV